MSNKVKIGVSSCLMGNFVRYDGGHKLDHYLRDTLGQLVCWVPVCPEVDSGLPVPREAMLLVGDPVTPRLVTRFTGIDHTERMMRWAKQELDRLDKLGLCGFVFKARSPSCAIRDTDIATPSGRKASQGAGLFAAALVRRFPSLPVEDEEMLHDPTVRQGFVDRIFACRKRLTSSPP